MAIVTADDFIAFLAPPKAPVAGVGLGDSAEQTIRRHRRSTHSDALSLSRPLREKSGGNWTYSPLVGLIHEREDKVYMIRSLILSGTLGEHGDKLVPESVLAKLSGCVAAAVTSKRGAEAVEMVVGASKSKDAHSISPRLAAFCLACCMKLGDNETRRAALDGALQLQSCEEFRTRYGSFMRLIGKGGATGDMATDSLQASATDSVGGIRTVLDHRTQRRMSRRSMDERSRLAASVKC